MMDRDSAEESLSFSFPSVFESDSLCGLLLCAKDEEPSKMPFSFGCHIGLGQAAAGCRKDKDGTGPSRQSDSFMP